MQELVDKIKCSDDNDIINMKDVIFEYVNEVHFLRSVVIGSSSDVRRKIAFFLQSSVDLKKKIWKRIAFSKFVNAMLY